MDNFSQQSDDHLDHSAPASPVDDEDATHPAPAAPAGVPMSRGRLYLVIAATVVLTVGVIGIVAGGLNILLRDGDGDGDDEAAATEATTEPAAAAPPPPPPATPDPDGSVSGRCDDLLGDPGPERYRFLASLAAENTGNIGIIGEVWVEFDQLGGDPVRYVEEVEVEAGEEVTVHFDETITREQWHRYSDAGWNCEFGWDLTDIFGKVQD